MVTLHKITVSQILYLYILLLLMHNPVSPSLQGKLRAQDVSLLKQLITISASIQRLSRTRSLRAAKLSKSLSLSFNGTTSQMPRLHVSSYTVLLQSFI